MDKNKVAVTLFNKLAETYQEKYMDVTLYGDSLDYFCAGITKEAAEILELACGPGNITRYLLDRRPDFRILGTDLSENMLDLARKNNPTATFELLDCRKIGRLEKTYDGIVCGFATPYLSKEETMELISTAAKLLNPGGLFYLSTMEDEYSNSTLKKGSTGEEIFMHFHQEDYLSESMIHNGLTIVLTDRKKYTIADGTLTTDLILIAKKS